MKRRINDKVGPRTTAEKAEGLIFSMGMKEIHGFSHFLPMEDDDAVSDWPFLLRSSSRRILLLFSLALNFLFFFFFL
jgi:hypothetical protein